MTENQNNPDIQRVLRGEIRDLKYRHRIEIALLHASYAMILECEPNVGEYIDLVARSELFDACWYLETYRDVGEGAIDAAEHYVRAGAFEGRDPGPEFKTMDYYLANPDVAEEGWPALVHFERCGRAESRALAPG